MYKHVIFKKYNAILFSFNGVETCGWKSFVFYETLHVKYIDAETFASL